MVKTVLNISNADALTDWIKAITWGDTVATIRYPDIKDRKFVMTHKRPIAQMLVHAYIKRNLPEYLAKYLNTPMLKPVTDMSSLSDAARAAAADGYPAYMFDASAVPGFIRSDITKLNEFLVDVAMAQISLRLKDADFALDMKCLDAIYPNITAAINTAKWPRQPSIKTTTSRSVIAGLRNKHKDDVH